jgi:hypothetical protein
MKPSARRPLWPWSAAVFLLVLIPQLAFVAVAGTDVPFHDQWNV